MEFDLRLACKKFVDLAKLNDLKLDEGCFMLKAF